MHVRARKQQSTSVFQYAPIAKALAQLSMDKRTEERTKRKFDIAYLVLWRGNSTLWMHHLPTLPPTVDGLL